MYETLALSKYFKNPISKNIIPIYNHLRRYVIAIEKLDINNSDTIIDIACGQGYGSYLLMQKALTVIGIDKNDKYIKIANKTFKNKYLSFTNTLPEKPDFKATKIICIETIEHLEKSKIKEFIYLLLDYLDMNGQIFFSFPIGNNAKSTYNKYHLCEPSIDFMLDIIGNKLYKITVQIESFINSFGHEVKYCFMWGSR